MNRIDRVTAMLIQLQSRKVVKAQDMADRFNVSLRTIYRDINTLEEAGVPIIGEAGVGYSIMDGYRLPPVMFTKEEATAFLTAEKLVEKLTDEATQTSYSAAMYKVRAVLRSTEKDMLESIEEHIHVFHNTARFNTGSVSNILQTLLSAVPDRKVLRIKYYASSSNQTTERQVEPLGIFYGGGYWHLVAYCTLRKDYRDFRVDRISGLVVTKDTFTQQHPTLKDYVAQWKGDKEYHPVVIRVHMSVARYIENEKYNYGFISQTIDGDHIEMTFLSLSLEGFARWMLMFADKSKIISPLSIKDRVATLLIAIKATL